MRENYVDVDTLPPSVQSALKSVHYGRKSIGISPQTTISFASAGGDGEKAFAIVVDLQTGAHETMWGSWGGANMFNPRNRVDLDTKERPLPPDAAVIKGHISGEPTYAYIEVHPANISRYLPAPEVLTDRIRLTVSIVAGIRGGTYRKEYFAKHHITEAEIQEAITGGYISRNKAGAISITTKGMNVPRADIHRYPD